MHATNAVKAMWMPKPQQVGSDLVPEVVGAVRAGGDEGAKAGVEGDVVDGVDVRTVAVALEREVLALRRVLHVVHRHAALGQQEWFNSVSLKCPEARDSGNGCPHIGMRFRPAMAAKQQRTLQAMCQLRCFRAG